jgi:chromosome segregation ATPase
LEASERLAELEAEVRDLRYRLGFSEGRLELTQKTESTLREERDRLLEDRDRERERAENLQRQLEEVRQPWWRKLFGD